MIRLTVLAVLASLVLACASPRQDADTSVALEPVDTLKPLVDSSKALIDTSKAASTKKASQATPKTGRATKKAESPNIGYDSVIRTKRREFPTISDTAKKKPH